MSSDEGLILADTPAELARRPSTIIEAGRKAAKELAAIVEASPNKLVLNKKQYLYFEHWQMLGRFNNVTAKVVSTTYVEVGGVHGFEARAVVLQNGVEISAAEADCLTDEPNWQSKPLFQLKSMAQTRACAKALRNVLSWIVVLAGYEPTPAEELDDEGKPKAPRPAKPPTKTFPVPRSDEPVKVLEIRARSTKNPQVKRYEIILSTGETVTTIKDWLATLAEAARENQWPVKVVTHDTKYGQELTGIQRADEAPKSDLLTDSDIPF